MDLSKVTFPTFVLEPRSMLERITDFMAHPDLIFGQVFILLFYLDWRLSFLSAENFDDPEERFIRVLQYYLAGWHIKPKGVKKPWVTDHHLSLVSSTFPAVTTLCLGSSFDADMTIPTEQMAFTLLSRVRSSLFRAPRQSHKYPPVSHHPPVSVFFYISPANHVSILGELRPKSKFLGNSVSTTMEGENRVTLLAKPDDGGKSLSFFWKPI